MSSSNGQDNVHQDKKFNDPEKSSSNRKSEIVENSRGNGLLPNESAASSSGNQTGEGFRKISKHIASAKDGGLEILFEGARGHSEATERLSRDLNLDRTLDSVGTATGGNAGSNHAWTTSSLETGAGAAAARELRLYQLESHQAAALSRLFQGELLARAERSSAPSSASGMSFAAPAMPFQSSTSAASESAPSTIGQCANGVDYAPLAAAIASLLQADRRSMSMAQPPSHETTLQLLRANAPWSASLINQLAPAPTISSSIGLHSSHQLPSSSLLASLLGKLQLASHVHNTAGLPAVTQNLPAVTQHQMPLPDHSASVQACLQSSLALSSQLMVAQENEKRSRQILACLHSCPEHATSPDFPHLLEKIVEENRDKERLVSSLLLHQQSSVLRSGTVRHDTAQDSGQSLASHSIPPIPALKSDRANYPHEASSPPTHPKAMECLVDPNPSKESRWMVRYEELKRFKQKYGHCRVPHGFPENRRLAWWVMNQRAQYRQLGRGNKSWISEDRVNLLNAIDFDWNPIRSKS